MGNSTAEFKLFYRKTVKPFLKENILCTVLLLVNSLLNVCFPYFIKLVVDEGIGKQNIQLIVLYSAVMIVTTVLNVITGYWMRINFLKLGQKVTYSIKKTINDCFDRYSQLLFNKYKNGEMVSILENDVKNVEVLTTYIVSDVLSNAVTAVGLFVLLLSMNAEIAVGSLCCILLFSVIQRKFGTQTKSKAKEVSVAKGNMHSFTQEYLEGIMEARMLNASREFQTKYLDTQRELFRKEIGMARVKVLSGLSGSLFQNISLILVLGYGAVMVLTDHLTIGSLFTLTIYVQKMHSPVLALFNLYIDVKKTQASLSRVMELIDVNEYVIQNGEWSMRDNLHGDVDISGLSFKYSDTPVLNSVNISINSGDSIAITGENGSGKTTLIKLLLRLMDNYEGSICIDGKDIREYDLFYLRSQIICISQTPFIFNGTIYENITMLKEDIPVEAVHEALRMVCLEEDLSKMPRGLDTPVRALGVRLSGGQAQKVALARAYLSNPSLIILDEPTSALDITGEQIVCRNLFTHFKDTTIIAITHRAELLKYCEAIYDIRQLGLSTNKLSEARDVGLQRSVFFEAGTKQASGLLGSS
ncbi:ABC-type bacteriocin/lantibiotic exporter with double-glycine peptidase domain [Fontibacillus solani]|uniref:ABC-type bacteriocin/lantibiotic exporter with double-glycine peptidase domain n=1 Tax=Fontibacillus solani TaxID=1572857 RepID=A0A7W3SPY7_9BACL|nr:ABC transporter ATP-binding protein [Fontibacillus solani]MBA9083934.1 ABC-type bacteriocin/lantibiotic exporter with double-glycine peptidase domain [Fontibacillus solani]